MMPVMEVGGDEGDLLDSDEVSPDFAGTGVLDVLITRRLVGDL